MGLGNDLDFQVLKLNFYTWYSVHCKSIYQGSEMGFWLKKCSFLNWKISVIIKCVSTLIWCSMTVCACEPRGSLRNINVRSQRNSIFAKRLLGPHRFSHDPKSSAVFSSGFQSCHSWAEAVINNSQCNTRMYFSIHLFHHCHIRSILFALKRKFHSLFKTISWNS